MFTDSMIPFWIAIGSLATAFAVIVAIVSWLRPRSHTVKPAKAPRLSVRRVVHPDDDDLPAAHDVYCKGITNESELDSFADIQRWLAEAEQAKNSPEPSELDEYLLIAKAGTRVCGFFYG